MKKKTSAGWFIFLSALLLLAPSGLGSDQGEVIIFTSWNMHRLDVRIARTPEDWKEGALGIEKFEETEGILFLYPRETIPTFTTKGISFPLDILLIDREGQIVGIYEEAFGDKHYALPRPIVAALEVSGGFCRKNGVSTGDRVRPLGISLGPKAAQAPKEEEKKRVEAKLQENVKAHPDDPVSYEELAVFYTLSGENEKAAAVYRDLLKIEPTAPRLNGLGVALAQLGKWEEAVTFFRQAMEKDPRFAGSYNNLAKFHLHQNEPDKAIALYEEAIRLHPDLLDVYLALTRLFLTTGDIDAAEALLQTALKNGANPTELFRAAGNVALRKGHLKKAAQFYLHHLQAHPFDQDAAELKAFILVHAALPQEAAP